MNEKGDLLYTGTGNLEVMGLAERYNAFLRSLVRSQAPMLDPSDIVVDFGAGIGTFSDVFAVSGHKIVCVEPDAAQRRILEQRFSATTSIDTIGDAEAGYIYSLNVLEHIPDDRTVLRQLAQKLRPGGRLFLYVPAFTLLWTAMDDSVGHVRRYRLNDLAQKVAGAGLTVVRAEYADSAGFFATLVYKWLDSVRPANGRLSGNAVVLFDRFAFPVGRLLDRLLFRRWLGKNVLVVAEKAIS